jgi:mannosyl-glycoprotein endo-beta-N-acetylglucosaminidase
LRGSKITAKTEVEINEQPAAPFYSFFHWWHIDLFVYFSHHFITVPPTVWTNQAHRHGVLMLGIKILLLLVN